MFTDSATLRDQVTSKILFWGGNNIGKTHNALTWPRCALVDFEGRAGHFRNRFRFLEGAPSNLTEARKFFKALKSGEVDCDTVVIDSLSAAYMALVDEFTKQSESGGWSTDWPLVNRRMAAFMDFLFTIRGKNVICTAHEAAKLERQGNNFKKNGDKFVLNESIRYAFDFIFKIEWRGNQRIAIVEKSMSPKLPRGSVLEIPEGARFHDLFTAAIAPKQSAGKPADTPGPAPRQAPATQAAAPPDLDAPLTDEEANRIAPAAGVALNLLIRPDQHRDVVQCLSELPAEVNEQRGALMLELTKGRKSIAPTDKISALSAEEADAFIALLRDLIAKAKGRSAA
jgi:hypothetical protein